MENMLKYLIIITLAYYLVKGLIYLMLWQMTYRVEKRSKETKEKAKKERMIRLGIWQDGDDE